MDNDGELGLLGKSHLVAKNSVLCIARRMIVKIVKTDFAPGNDFGMLRQPSQLIQMLWRYFLRFVRMDSHCGVNPIVMLGEG